MHGDDAIFIDEMGVAMNLSRVYARAPIGQRAHETAPAQKGTRHTLLGAMSSKGMLTELVFEGYLDAQLWRVFVRDFLVPELEPGQVVILDNLASHKDTKAKEMIEEAGARVVYLPPYSPELSPIELCWSKLKALIRAGKPRDFDQLIKAAAEAIEAITEADASGWFRHCGFHECERN